MALVCKGLAASVLHARLPPKSTAWRGPVAQPPAAPVRSLTHARHPAVPWGTRPTIRDARFKLHHFQLLLWRCCWSSSCLQLQLPCSRTPCTGSQGRTLPVHSK